MASGAAGEYAPACRTGSAGGAVSNILRRARSGCLSPRHGHSPPGREALMDPICPLLFAFDHASFAPYGFSGSGFSGGVIAISIVGVVASTFIALIWMLQRGRERRRRFDLLETALRNPNLTPEVQRDLARSLHAPRMRVPFVIGWFGLFAGIGWLCTDPHGEEQVMAWLATLGAFALLTLPFALKELETRGA